MYIQAGEFFYKHYNQLWDGRREGVIEVGLRGQGKRWVREEVLGPNCRHIGLGWGRQWEGDKKCRAEEASCRGSDDWWDDDVFLGSRARRGAYGSQGQGQGALGALHHARPCYHNGVGGRAGP